MLFKPPDESKPKLGELSKGVLQDPPGCVREIVDVPTRIVVLRGVDVEAFAGIV